MAARKREREKTECFKFTFFIIRYYYFDDDVDTHSDFEASSRRRRRRRWQMSLLLMKSHHVSLALYSFDLVTISFHSTESNDRH